MKSLMEDSAQFESEQAGAVGTTAATGAQQVPDTYTTHFTHKFCIQSFDTQLTIFSQWGKVACIFADSKNIEAGISIKNQKSLA